MVHHTQYFQLTLAERTKFAKKQFEEADTNKDASLSLAECDKLVAKVTVACGYEMPPIDKVHTLMELCDTDGDGELQRGEFLSFFKTVMVAARDFHQKNTGSVVKKIGGKGNGGERTVPVVPADKFYPADDEDFSKSRKGLKKDIAREMHSNGTTKLRASIVPGTVLINVTGRFRGRRCVFLKQLKETGLLLVSGPYCVNGIPLRRVNQRTVIATSTVLDISGVDASALTDSDFGKAAKKHNHKNKKADDLFSDEKASTGPSAARLAQQTKVDAALMKAVEKQGPVMAKYLKATFSLSKGDVPHRMKF